MLQRLLMPTTPESESTGLFLDDHDVPYMVPLSEEAGSGVTAASDDSSSDDISTPTNVTTFTVYLIRHCEASHNVQEKAAKKLAMEQAIAEGYAADSDYTKELMEEARKDVLNDETLFDAALSEEGREEAKKASMHFHEQLLHENNLPEPGEVLVSPLNRTLSTADIMFPHHNSIRVREELRERCTGKPPDTRSSSNTLSQSYRRFSTMRLKRLSMLQMFNSQSLSDSDGECDCDAYRKGYVAGEDNAKEEDKPMLRVRTQKLFGLLSESKERVIAIVTHKAYLRELERGPFGRPEAKEFKNGECRVYHVTVNNDKKSLVDADRIV